MHILLTHNNDVTNFCQCCTNPKYVRVIKYALAILKSWKQPSSRTDICPTASKQTCRFILLKAMFWTFVQYVH